MNNMNFYLYILKVIKEANESEQEINFTMRLEFS